MRSAKQPIGEYLNKHDGHDRHCSNDSNQGKNPKWMLGVVFIHFEMLLMQYPTIHEA